MFYLKLLVLLKMLYDFFQNRPGAVYSEDEGRFAFGSIVVGTRAEARFRISNISKVKINVHISYISCSALSH